MVPESPNPDVLQKTTERVARFIQWVVELFRRRDWFTLLVLVGVSLAIAGGFLRDRINEMFFSDGGQGPFWASFITVVVLLFVGAFAVAVATMPRQTQASAADMAERKAIKGLRPFAKDDAEVFSRLQREVSLRECCEAVTSEGYKFGILLGESGCGKTSFLQAGMWPRLSQPESSHRGVYVRFSDQEPLGTIGKAIAEQLEIPPEWLQDLTFEKLLAQAVEAAGKPVVLLLDQFEQFFVHNPRQEDRKAFTKALTGWYDNPSLDRVKLVVSIRADLLHELYELQRALQYDLGPRDCFKLERFSPDEAARVLGVIAETERLECDPRFVAELAEQELAHRDTGTISPVDVQILAWMIERQKDDELRAFNRAAFQKFGGVEGLLTRFLDRTLETRVLPAQRLAAVKVLLALTDLDRQVRAGVLTVAELQQKVGGTAKPEEVTEAVGWLSRGDVRLITPQDKGGELGYELAHERLIPALMRVAGKELTEADKANQLLERRVNEWLGNGRSGRYLLGWRELWRVRRQRPYLQFGAKRRQKETLIRVSQRRVSWVLGGMAAVVLVIGFGFGYLNLTTWGHIQQARWVLGVGFDLEHLSDERTADIVYGLVEDNQHDKGIKLIKNHINSQSNKVMTLQGITQIAVRLADLNLLQKVSVIAGEIDSPQDKSDALNSIASAYGRLDNTQLAQAFLQEALEISEKIDLPRYKSDVLMDIANIYSQLQDAQQAQIVLQKALKTAEKIDSYWDRSAALSKAANIASHLKDTQQAQLTLQEVMESTKKIDSPRYQSDALISIAKAYAQLNNTWQTQTAIQEALWTIEEISPLEKSIKLGEVANVCSQMNNTDQAQISLRKVLESTSKMDFAWYEFRSLIDIANAHSKLRNTLQAQRVLKLALEAAEEIEKFKGFEYRPYTLSHIADVYDRLGNAQQAGKTLQRALEATEEIDDPQYKSSALRLIAETTGQLRDPQQAQIILSRAIKAAEEIDDSSSRFYALSDIIKVVIQLGDTDIAQNLLLSIRPLLKGTGMSSILEEIALYELFLGNWRAARRTHQLYYGQYFSEESAQILKHYAKSKTPELIDGPVILAIGATKKPIGSYKLNVKIQSPDEDCDRHVDWWEVLTEDGDLIDRYIIETPHEFERPFTTEKAIALDPDQTIIVRAHFSDDIDGNEYNGDDKYPTQAMKGIVGKPNSFKSIRLPARFAIGVEDEEPQPQECKPKA